MWKQENQLRENCIFLKADDHGLDLFGSGEICSDSGYCLKVEPTFVDELVIEGDRKRLRPLQSFWVKNIKEGNWSLLVQKTQYG